MDAETEQSRTTTPWVDPAHPQDSIQNWYNGLWIDPNDAQELKNHLALDGRGFKPAPYLIRG